ncbi:ABC transporter ATP-binding protein [Oceanobacillus chungangensis]|uniref:Quaternary amine transport ATP-binding protein n=1 Tax=Oceanobacillus chungangensis TaxID=1229152 RepID=A0A3D8PUG0_9BACI|nr:ABC transporter ATP-binding protein [Oceanobacillus chungangensis]RDW19790.1 glycine/betaine ABC transporter ATP-binding protein [Oceanobacillus chungangensis]
MIRFEDVAKQYQDDTYAVKLLNLEIKKGEFFVLIGPSGSGKTTTLKMINRLIPLTDGTIYIEDKRISDYEINELRWNIGYVLQQIALFPHMTIEENIAIVPELKKWDRDKVKNRVTELLEMVGLDPEIYRKRKPKELSGGEQQRIGVVRALAADPEIILMDEPFSALDPITREKLQDDILALQRTINKTIVFVTHDMKEALKLGDRICVMKNGRVEQIGTPEQLLNQPANDFILNFVGEGNKLHHENIELSNLVRPYDDETEIVNLTDSLPVTATIQTILERLATEEQLPVEKDGEIIGVINREIIIQYLSDRLNERGKAHE